MKSVYVLSLLALTVLSACGNKEDPAAQLSGGVVDSNSILIPGEEGPEGQANIQMIRAGLHEANEVRRRLGLPFLQHDINLTIAAQQKARQLCNTRGQQGPWFPGQGGDGFNRRMDDSNSDGIPALPAFGDNQSQGFGRAQRGPQPLPQQPQFPPQPGMTVENSARGLRSVQQVFLLWQQRQIYAQNLFSPGFHHQGIGYCDGIWIHLLAN